MGPLDKFILSDDALRKTGKGLSLHFKSHWYRSLPMSCMDMDLKLNGTPMERSGLKVEVNGKSFPLNMLPEMFNEWLFILDKAILHLEDDPSILRGQKYSVEFNLQLSIPYVQVGGDGNPLLVSSKVNRILICQ